MKLKAILYVILWLLCMGYMVLAPETPEKGWISLGLTMLWVMHALWDNRPGHRPEPRQHPEWDREWGL